MTNPNQPNLSLEQWEAWLLDPATQALQAWAKGQRNELRDMWEGAHFEAPNVHETAMRNSAAIGACSVYQEIEALNFETVTGAQEDVSEH